MVWTTRSGRARLGVRMPFALDKTPQQDALRITAIDQRFTRIFDGSRLEVAARAQRWPEVKRSRRTRRITPR